MFASPQLSWGWEKGYGQDTYASPASRKPTGHPTPQMAPLTTTTRPSPGQPALPNMRERPAPLDTEMGNIGDIGDTSARGEPGQSQSDSPNLKIKGKSLEIHFQQVNHYLDVTFFLAIFYQFKLVAHCTVCKSPHGYNNFEKVIPSWKMKPTILYNRL